jgi:uncharacterized protein YndB with AHSA1/START domain
MPIEIKMRKMKVTINKNAPVVQSKEIIIHAKPEKVWEIMIDIDKWSDWNKNIREAKTIGTPSVGSTFKWTNNGSKITSTIHTLKKNSMIGWTGKNFAAKAIHNWYLTPTEDGTKVLTEESMESWIMSLMKKKMNNILAEDMTSWLEFLKVESEK